MKEYKITLEKWNAEDYKDFFNASNDEELYKNMNHNFPKTIDECRKLVNFFSESTDTTEYIRAIKSNGQIIGCIAAFFQEDMYQKNAEIAYWININYRNKGIMPKIIKAFSQDLFSKFDLDKILAKPFQHNKASQRVLEKAGFHFEGIFLNSIIYSIKNRL